MRRAPWTILSASEFGRGRSRAGPEFGCISPGAAATLQGPGESAPGSNDYRLPTSSDDSSGEGRQYR